MLLRCLLLVNPPLLGHAIAVTEPKAGAAFDAAPFGFPIDTHDGNVVGIRWAEPRKITRVVAQFPGDTTLPNPAQVKLQYWHATWDGRSDAVRGEAGAGGVGWDAMDDWTNGRWKDADTTIDAPGQKWTFTFKPSGEREFDRLGKPGVRYRKTLKIRLLAPDSLPPNTQLHAYTDAVLRPLDVRILWGQPAGAAHHSLAVEDKGHLEVHNGHLLALSPVAHDNIRVDDRMNWSRPESQPGGISVKLLIAVDPTDAQYDRPVVTVRSSLCPFSFAADEVARGERIFVDDLGVLVTRGDDPAGLEDCRAARAESRGRTVYDRVFDQPEQTLAGAWDAMPLKRPLHFIHGLPGNRNSMRENPGGQIVVVHSDRWFNLPPSKKDTGRKSWDGPELELSFGISDDRMTARRDLQDGNLPMLRTWQQRGDVYCEQRTVLDKLDGDLSHIGLDDPTCLLVRIRVVNTSDREAHPVSLSVSSKANNVLESLTLKGDRVYAKSADQNHFRYVIKGVPSGSLVPVADGLQWTHQLAPGAAHNLYCFIPSITLTNEDEIGALSRRNFEGDSARVCDYWRELMGRGASIHTPEPWINDFYKSHLTHMLINCFKEIGSDRLHPHVGTLIYGVYADESAMMISDLDRRGYHDEARRCLDSFLHYQGTVGLPGNFKSTQGVFNGTGRHEDGGYNKNHGWIMWVMAEHWRMTRDRDWMQRAAPGLVEACEWVIRERRATMTTSADGTRPIEYGFLPAGSLEDVTDYWTWLVTNACTVWGFESLADALADFGHPDAERLQKEAKAFRGDVLQGLKEARIRAAVVRLRDGTYVPKYPSRLYERGRAHGWLRETLEGSIHLLITGLMRPDAPEAQWILKDYEDNLYISNEYGYAIPSFDTFWFSRGGFSMQANLLGGPLAYLYRDEIKHFLRGYFNGFASAFYPDLRMCNEHSLPELGYPRGDVFKSSDEAQSNYWLRLMFIHEEDQDLYLGQALPRYWLADSQRVSIERAPSYFGPLSFQINSNASIGTITARLTPPLRNPPKRIFLRLRHPDAKPIRSVTLNGHSYDKFDAQKEWIILDGGEKGLQEVVARYDQDRR